MLLSCPDGGVSGTPWPAHVIASVAKQPILSYAATWIRCARNDGWAEFCGLTCRCATQNMHEHPHRTHTDWLREHGASITTPLAAGGRVFVHHDEQLPLEATRPGLLGTPGLVYSSSLAASGRLGFNAGNGPSGQAPIGGVAVFLGLCHGRGFAVLRGLRGIAVRTAP